MKRRQLLSLLGASAAAGLCTDIVQAGVPRPGALLVSVNDWVNRRYRYARDSGDLWLTPLELHGSGEGDCEDLAICKMLLLAEYGVASRLGYVQHVTEGAHMVCVVATEVGVQVVLDNLARDIVALEARRDLSLRLWFDARGIADAAGTEMRPSSAVYQWEQMRQRWQWQQAAWRLLVLPEARSAVGS